MSPEELSEEEKELLRVHRSVKAQREEQLPVLTREDFQRRLRVELALGTARITKSTNYLQRISNLWPNSQEDKYPGPLVILTGTLAHLKESWEIHSQHAIEKGASGPVVRHHREAISYYCEAIGLDWRPEIKRYEKRALAARARASQVIELPANFLDLVRAVVNDVQYHKDPALNAMFQHRARLNFYTAPRTPSEDARLRCRDVHVERGSLTYRVTKTAGVEAKPIEVPREVYGLGPHVLTWPKRKSYAVWVTHWRPKLINKARHRGLLGPKEDHDFVWVGIDGMSMDPDLYRKDFGLHAKTVWPGFYPYLCREVGIIMKALEIYQECGSFDLYRLRQWTGHSNFNNLAGYLRAGEGVLRQAKPGPELDALLYEWRTI